MADLVPLGIGQRIRSDTGTWYQNVQKLGSGGSAVTHLVVATSGIARGTPYALKMFRRISKRERRDSLRREIEFLRSCNHPSIMRVFEAGVYLDDHPFVVAEYLPSTLAEVIRQNRITNVERIWFTLQLLSALAYLAERKPPVVHRDVKPKNILVKGRSCVFGDFGLMKFVDDDDASDREFLKESEGAGMPRRYRTPDLVAYLRDEARITAKSDVYQLGLVVAELFTGHNPQLEADFEAPVQLQPLQNIQGRNAPQIESLINQMLVERPEERDGASAFLDPWEGLLLKSVKHRHARKGRVF